MRTALLWLILSTTALAVEVPFLSGPVVDEASVLSETEKQRLTAAVEAVNGTGKIQMAVLIPRSLQGEEIEPYAIAVAEKWKLGKKKQDDGLLFIVAPQEKRMRFEVGYGLEGDLTDAYTKRILDEVVAPYLKAGRFADGLIAGTAAVAQKLGLELDRPAPPPRKRKGGDFPWILIFFLLYFLFTAIRRSGGGGFGGGPRFGGGGGWGGGRSGGWSGGGSSFGGGGGGFGGGGSSSSW